MGCIFPRRLLAEQLHKLFLETAPCTNANRILHLGGEANTFTFSCGLSQATAVMEPTADTSVQI